MKHIFIFILFIAYAFPCHAQWKNTYMGAQVLAFGVHDASFFVGVTPDVPQGPLVWLLGSLTPNVVWVIADSGIDPSQGNVNLFGSLGRYFFAAPYGHRIYSTTNEGAQWSPVNAAGPFCSNGTYLFAYYYFPTILIRSGDSGKTWDSVANFAATNFATLGYNIIAVNSSGIWHSTNNGSNWTFTSAPITGTLTPMDSLLFIVGSGKLAESTDSGSDWSIIPVDSAGVPATVNCLATDGKNLFAGTSTGVLISTDFGKDWTAKNDSITYQDIYHDNLKVSEDVTQIAVFDTFVFADVYYDRQGHGDGYYLFYRPISELTKPDSPLSVVQMPPSDTIEVYPNPASGTVTIHDGNTSILGVSIINVLGLDVLDIPNTNQSDVTFDVSKRAAGTYFVRIQTPKGTILKKITIL